MYLKIRSINGICCGKSESEQPSVFIETLPAVLNLLGVSFPFIKMKLRVELCMRPYTGMQQLMLLANTHRQPCTVHCTPDCMSHNFSQSATIRHTSTRIPFNCKTVLVHTMNKRTNKNKNTNNDYKKKLKHSQEYTLCVINYLETQHILSVKKLINWLDFHFFLQRAPVVEWLQQPLHIT